MAPTPITPAELWAVLMAISNNIMATGFGQLGHIDPSIPSHITIGGHRFAQELLAANEQQRATRAGWAKLSTEVKSKIFKFAMTAEGKSINLPCLSNAAYKPNIAVGLLSVNRAIYHEARNYLFEENILTFNLYATDLMLMSQAVGLWKCRIDGDCAAAVPPFGTVVFDIGDTDGHNTVSRCHGFMCSIQQMRKPLFVKNLVINLLPNTFENVAQVYRFATCLMNVTVLGTFQLTGFDYQLCHLDLSLAAFASSLMMNCQPVQAFFKPCDMVTKVPGTFKNVYVPAQTLADVDPKQGQQIEDSAWMFAEYCMTDEGMDHYQW